jgi:hypothetical protein
MTVRVCEEQVAEQPFVIHIQSDSVLANVIRRFFVSASNESVTIITSPDVFCTA